MFGPAAALLLFTALAAGAAAAAQDSADPNAAALGLRRLSPPAAATPTRAAASTAQSPASASPAASDRPRIYSLHRDYGETPDRTVLPPAFFLVPGEAGSETEPTAPAPVRDRYGRPVADAAGPDGAPS